MLRRVGFDVDTATTAADALDYLARPSYAVIVADCILPGLQMPDWFATLRGSRGETPLILTSGRLADDELRAAAAEFGAAAVLEKSFSFEVLVATVRAALVPAHRTSCPA